jgi:hypothetical protein
MNLRKLAEGKECQVRLPGICSFNTEQTVLAHIKRGWFGSLKPPDICGVWSCHVCHDYIDGRRQSKNLTREEINTAVLEALVRQLNLYVDMGILKW